MSPVELEYWNNNDNLPRTCGDEPSVKGEREQVEKSAPHLRG